MSNPRVVLKAPGMNGREKVGKEYIMAFYHMKCARYPHDVLFSPFTEMLAP